MRHVISISGAPEHDLDDDGWRTVVSSADAAAELAELDDLLASLGDPAAGDDELLLRLGALDDDDGGDAAATAAAVGGAARDFGGAGGVARGVAQQQQQQRAAAARASGASGASGANGASGASASGGGGPGGAAPIARRARIEALVARRAALRRAGEFGTADQIQRRLLEHSVEVQDPRGGARADGAARWRFRPPPSEGADAARAPDSGARAAPPEAARRRRVGGGGALGARSLSTLARVPAVVPGAVLISPGRSIFAPPGRVAPIERLVALRRHAHAAPALPSTARALGVGSLGRVGRFGLIGLFGLSVAAPLVPNYAGRSVAPSSQHAWAWLQRVVGRGRLG